MAGTPQQLVFDLPVRPALGRRDLLVADCNAEAVAWLDRWPDTWPAKTVAERAAGAAPGLVIWGPKASGKTHLASVWDHRAQARWLDGGDLDSPDLVPEIGGANVILDDLDRLLDGSPARQEQVFHLFNRLRAEGGAMLVTGLAPPSRWGLALRDLASRLNSLPSASIGPPDDALLAALVVKHFRDRQVRVEPGVVDYVLRRMDRSFRGVDRIVAVLDRAALAAGRPVTVPLARRTLESMPAVY